MQVRLKVQRAHAAILESLSYWKRCEREAFQAHQEFLDDRTKEIMYKKSFCGGYKYNEIAARKIARDGYPGQWIGDERFSATCKHHETCANILDRMHHLEQQTRDKSGFMVWFEESDYIKFSCYL